MSTSDSETPAPRTDTWSGTDSSAVGAELPSRWQLERELGSGGQADVWLAHDRELRQRVALKVFRGVLSGPRRERLRREITLGRELQQRGLVRVYELIEGEGCLALAMEWIPGGSAAELLREGALDPERVVEMARQILETLTYLHGKGVVHRDVKPSNLLLDADGRVRLADLGLARPLQGARSVTRTAAAIGTPAYMSPEQLRGERPAPASDLYSLGATLYHLLTGSPPFKGSSEFQVADSHLRGPIPDPRDLCPEAPRWLARFVMRLLEKRPGDRWQNAGAALQALNQRRTQLSPRRVRRLVIGAGAVLAVAVALHTVAGRASRALAAASARGDTVVAADAAGKELWQKRLDGTIDHVLVADVAGSSAPEVVAAVWRWSGQNRREAGVVVLSRRGEIIRRLEVAQGLIRERYPHIDPDYRVHRLWVLDVDGDRRHDLVWLAKHNAFYPSELGAWCLRGDEWHGPLITHSGHLQTLAAADLDDDGTAEIVAAGVNNLLGYQLAVVVVDPLRLRAVASPVAAGSPDDLPAWTYHQETYGDANPAVAYTVLGTCGASPSPTIEAAGPAGIVVAHEGRVYEIDRWGNPRASPVFGRGGGARSRFWAGLGKVSTSLQTHPERAQVELSRLMEAHADVVAEDPTHLAAVLLAARSLARARQHAAAAGLLESARDRHGGELDLWLRLGEYRALAGDHGAARETLRAAATLGVESPRCAEPIRQLLRLAAFDRDSAGFQRALELWSTRFHDADEALVAKYRGLWAFYRGEWANPALQDYDEPTVMRELLVAREWARLERGRDPAATLGRLQEMGADVDTREFARVLDAYALLLAGDTERAGGVVDLARTQLELRARESLEHALWLPLADWVAGSALHAAGRTEEAGVLLRQAAAAAPSCWFGTAAPAGPGHGP